MRYLFVLLVLSGCSARQLLKRSKQFEEMAIAKGAHVVADTVFKEVPLIRTETRTDTIFQAKQGDTVVIEKERLKVKYVRLKGDSVFIFAQAKADTVFVKVPYTVSREISTGHGDWEMIVLGIFCLVVGFFCAIGWNSIKRNKGSN